MIEQRPLRLLLEDQIFKTWFARKPISHTNDKWRVWVQEVEGGRWTRMSVKSWKKGFKFVDQHLDDCWDMALGNAIWEYAPPIVRVNTGLKDAKTKKVIYKIRYRPPEAPTDHYWCGLCRRPTAFGYFTRHHALGRMQIMGNKLRCKICGHSLDALKRYTNNEEE